MPFNEGWGQFDANKAVDAIRSIDATRTIDHPNGWHDQKGGDSRAFMSTTRLIAIQAILTDARKC
ncbi:MAG: hypothetical protein R2912_10850 [Eubacteriales bacterium]